MSNAPIQRSAKVSTIKAALADIFMSLTLIMVWLLYMSPSHTPVDAVPDQSLPPTDHNPGDRPAAGQNVARIDVGPEGRLSVQTDGQTLAYRDFQKMLGEDNSSFPDHIIFAFPDYRKLQLIGEAALENDANVSIELQR